MSEETVPDKTTTDVSGQAQVSTKSEETQKEETIQKAEHEEAIKQKEEQLSKMKADLDKANLQLLDPKYLDYLEASKKPKDEPKTSKKEESTKTPEEVAALEKKISDMESTLSNLLAQQELEAVRQKYSDFDEYKPQIQTLIQNGNTDLNFEQLYRLAKSYEQDKEAIEEKGKEKDKKPFSTEKPGSGVPGKDLEETTYKSEAEADAATLNMLKEKYPHLQGDKI